MSLSVNASVVHREYRDMYPDWEKCRDCYRGASAIKKKREKYLPIPNGEDTSYHNIQKYNNYLLRAVFLNVVAPTVNDIVGSILKREPHITLPDIIEYLREDVSGEQVGLNEYIKEVLTNLGINGRAGLLIDQLPSNAQNKAEELKDNIYPRINLYLAENIINWHDTIINGIKQPDLIVLSEVIEVNSSYNPFEYECKIVYRKLELNNGVYVQTLWDQHKQIPFDSGNYFIVPKKTGDIPFDYIPFVFLGITSNTSKVDQPPLLPLAELNLGHYRNSADLEEACFLVGQPTLVTNNLDQVWVDKNFKSGISLGSGTNLPLPKDSQAELLQAAPNNLVKEVMLTKEEQMYKVGLRAKDGATGRETAFAAGLRFTSDESIMINMATSVEKGFKKAFDIVYDYMTGEKPEEGTVKFKINKVFYNRSIDSQLVLAFVKLYEKRTVTFDELRDNLSDLGIKIDSEIDIEIIKKELLENDQNIEDDSKVNEESDDTLDLDKGINV